MTSNGATQGASGEIGVVTNNFINYIAIPTPTSSLSVAPICITINNANAIATVTTSASSPVISYSWTNASGTTISQTNNTSSLTNTVSNLSNGNYTVTSQINAPCGSINSQTININCICSLILSPSVTLTNANCNSSSGSVTINSITNGVPNYTITESVSTLTTNITLPYTISNVSIGTHTY